jgi:hypothetical protein
MERWFGGAKTVSQAIGLGMELWTDKEFNDFDKDNKHPIKFSNKQKTQKLITNLLLRFGCKKRPLNMNRNELFGRQARYEFCGEDQIHDFLSYLQSAIGKAAIELNTLEMMSIKEYSLSDGEEASHKIKQLQYVPSKGIFYDQFISETIINMVSFEIEENIKEKYEQFLAIVRKSSNIGVYPHLFESHIRNFLSFGFTGKVRKLESTDTEILNFQRLFFEGDFVYKTHDHKNPVQILFEENAGNKLMLLGANGFDSAVLLSPTEPKCATFDDIVICPGQNAPSHIIFIQTTISNAHPLKHSGILGMLLLAMMVELNTGFPPYISFAYIVPDDLFEEYVAPQTKLLKEVFKTIDIFVVSIVRDSINDKNENFYLKTGLTATASFFKDGYFSEERSTSSINKVFRKIKFQNSSLKPQIDIYRSFKRMEEEKMPLHTYTKNPYFINVSKQKWGDMEISVHKNKIVIVKNTNKESEEEEEKDENKEEDQNKKKKEKD